jgi:PKD domain
MKRSVWGKRCASGAAIIAIVAGIAFAPESRAYLSSAAGDVSIISPPSSVLPTGVGDPTKMLAFDELQGITLATPLKVDFTAVGTYTVTGRAQYVPAGTVVDSHYITSNRPPGGTTVRHATYTFAQDILGVIATRSKLDESDVLGFPTTSYGGGYPSRELEFGSGGDWVQIVNARTLVVHVNSTTVVDQVRVVTKHNQAPTPHAGGPYSGTEGTAVALAGAAVDPDGDPLVHSWAFSASGDPGLVCTPSGTSTLTPSITCNDDATITAVLSSKDAYHPFVASAPTVITIGNVAPTIPDLTLPIGEVAVGASVSLSATYADIGSNDSHVASIDWGDTTSSSGTVIAGPNTINGSHSYSSAGVFSVVLTVTDDNGGNVTSTGAVTVNGPPTANANGPYAGSEGDVIALAGTTTDPEGDPLVPTWTFTPGPADPGTSCTSTGTGTSTPTITCNDDVVVTADLSVTDGINPPTQSSTNVTINNAPPVITGLTVDPPPIVMGQTITIGGGFTDPATNDTHTAVVDWGDTTSDPATVVESAGSGTLTATHAYASPGTYLLTVSVSDDNGGTDTETLLVTVNSPPTVTAGGPYVGLEGDANALVGSANDIDGDPLSASWTFSWTGSANCITSGTTTLTPTITCDDDTVVSATLTVDDGVNAPVSSSATLSIGNASPTAGSVGITPASIHAFTNANVAVNFADAGTGDTHTATIDWGDSAVTTGVVVESSGSGTVSGIHQYSAAGTYTITVTIVDDDGGSVVATGTTGVDPNDAPVADAGGPYAVDEGTSVTLAGTASDTESDPLTYSWSFSWLGSGTCTASDITTLTPSITCDDNTLVTAVLTADDSHSLSAPAAGVVSVANVDPSIASVTPSVYLLPVGTSMSVAAAFSDAGTNDTHTASIDWDDATTSSGGVVESGGSGTASASHTYTAAGIYSISATVTDDDGGSVTATSLDYVVVYNPAFGRIETGGHRYFSPSGAYTPENSGDPDITGTAFLGMNVEYALPTDTVPSGSAHLRFNLPTLKFDSTAVTWLVVDPSLEMAWFAGSGTVNGVPGYDFVAGAVDGHPTPDFSRLRIVHHSTGTVIYDSQFGDPDNALATTPSTGGFLRIVA